jgi:hypothetical protein
MPFAMVSIHKHPKETWNQQEPFLHERIIPMVKAMPGFIAGHWSIDRSDYRSHSFILFASEADAARLATFIKDEASRPNPFGVQLLSASVSEVMGDASAKTG